MKTQITYKEFTDMRLMPADHNGEEFNATIEFNDNSLRRVPIRDTDLLLSKPGDTVRVLGRIVFDGVPEKRESVMIFMDTNRLTEFVERFGTSKITGTVRVRLMLRYAVCEESPDPKRRGEVVAFRLLELYE
ncbi:MAG: hypothetical protein IKJ69_03995 [Clostridia bacterium]|nr:hypothetical protein [Clostridia bacterium]